MRKGILFLALLMYGLVFGQGNGHESTSKYWIFLKDKGLKVWQPEEVLSARALERRAKHGLLADKSDWPVDAGYLRAIGATGARLRHPSRWFNAVSAWMDDETLAMVAALPFVQTIAPIKPYLRDLDPAPEASTKYGYSPGYTTHQLTMIELDVLHRNGYNGRDVLISVMDNGFKDANKNPHLSHLFSSGRIIATHDFVNDEADVFDQGNHGQWVLSILAGWYEGDDASANFYGSAHGASYVLCHTESDASETTQEEDNWVAAMEYADSIGADIFSTSLGYRDFDGGFDYGYAGMDGNTTIITRGANIATSKGIVVVNSAGNSGNNKINAPADGYYVIAVGAVDSLRNIASFSSRGPSFDQRIKPDVCAMGAQTSYIQSSGVFSRGNGTSFSCPVISGMLACLLQAKPEAPNHELRQALLQSCDRFENPDSVYGYGIPFGRLAFKALTGTEPAMIDHVFSWKDADGPMLVYPNPFHSSCHVAVDNDTVAYPARMEWVDARGAVVWKKEITIHPFYNLFSFDTGSPDFDLLSGTYTVRVYNTADKEKVRAVKAIFIPNR